MAPVEQDESVPTQSGLRRLSRTDCSRSAHLCCALFIYSPTPTRAFPGAITGMKAPQYAAWVFAQLGTRAGDQLVDLFPGSGAVSEAWRRYTAAAPNDSSSSPPAAAGAPVAPDDVSPTPAIAEVLSDASRGSSSGSPGDVERDTSPAHLATSGSAVGEVSQCAACVEAAGDPRPEEFAVRVAGIPGGQVDGTRRCGCGRVYGRLPRRVAPAAS